MKFDRSAGLMIALLGSIALGFIVDMSSGFWPPSPRYLIMTAVVVLVCWAVVDWRQ
jgi:hypothetical protein